MTDGDDQLAAVFPHDRYLASAHPLTTEKLTPTEKTAARKLLTKFLLASEANKTRIHYTQARPFKPRVYPEDGYQGDCSSYVTQAFFYAWDVLDGVPLHDPNGPVEYDGWGYTGTLLSTNHRHPVPFDRKFFVGDLALYGSFYNTRHVTVCRKGGFATEAIWSSHGSEAGPRPEGLHYRSDLLTVLRPASLL